MVRTKDKSETPVGKVKLPPLPAQLPDEEDFHYAIFKNYCLMGRLRSQEKVTEMYYGRVARTNKNTGKPPSLSKDLSQNRLKEISVKNNWVSRACDYDILCQRYYERYLVIKAQENRQEWVERGLAMDRSQTKLMMKVCEQVEEYILISESRKSWIQRNQEKLSTDQRLLNTALDLQTKSLDVAEKVIKVSDRLFEKDQISRITQATKTYVINTEFDEQKELAALTVEALKGSQVEEKT